ncbi:hypothetical protein ACFL01_03215, partial [Planctomycetota bacterium]
MPDESELTPESTEAETDGAEAVTEDQPSILAKHTAAVLGLPVTIYDTILIVLLTVAADACLYIAPGGTGAAVLLVLGSAGCLAAAWAFRKNVPIPLLVVLLLASAVSMWNHCWLLS